MWSSTTKTLWPAGLAQSVVSFVMVKRYSDPALLLTHVLEYFIDSFYKTNCLRGLNSSLFIALATHRLSLFCALTRTACQRSVASCEHTRLGLSFLCGRNDYTTAVCACVRVCEIDPYIYKHAQALHFPFFRQYKSFNSLTKVMQMSETWSEVRWHRDLCPLKCIYNKSIIKKKVLKCIKNGKKCSSVNVIYMVRLRDKKNL